MSVYGHSCLS